MRWAAALALGQLGAAAATPGGPDGLAPRPGWITDATVRTAAAGRWGSWARRRRPAEVLTGLAPRPG